MTSTRKIAFWTSTAFITFAFAAGGLFDLSKSPAVMESMQHLGYPTYLATLLGTWKVLGALAVVAPRLPRLKEWAYAGMFFDLTGAVVSHAAVGDGAPQLLPPLILLGMVLTSWLLRSESRRLGALVPRAPHADLRPELAHTPA